jgi:hypothetical protein
MSIRIETGAEVASRCASDSIKMIRLLGAPALQDEENFERSKNRIDFKAYCM